MEQKAVEQAADDHTEQQHAVQQGHHAGALFFGGQVGGQRHASRLRDLQAQADEHEAQRHAQTPDPQGVGHGVGEQQQRERHDGQAAEQQQGAHPQIGQALEAQHRGMRVAAVAHHGAQRCQDQRRADGKRHPPGRDTQFQNHHAVERAHQQRGHHADDRLEQRQAQQPSHG